MRRVGRLSKITNLFWPKSSKIMLLPWLLLYSRNSRIKGLKIGRVLFWLYLPVRVMVVVPRLDCCYSVLLFSISHAHHHDNGDSISMIFRPISIKLVFRSKNYIWFKGRWKWRFNLFRQSQAINHQKLYGKWTWCPRTGVVFSSTLSTQTISQLSASIISYARSF